ncbi:MAG: hypothetical protein ACREN8_13335 [Candidatus Dormibacteraceae bacterium]
MPFQPLYFPEKPWQAAPAQLLRPLNFVYQTNPSFVVIARLYYASLPPTDDALLSSKPRGISKVLTHPVNLDYNILLPPPSLFSSLP